jgi:2-phospho-L-lactate guanylyltransferase
VSVWAVVPAKDFARAKSRLSPALPDRARAAFARDIFGQVLAALVRSEVVAGVLVATDSDEVAAAARAVGALVRPDLPGASGLAAIVDAALAEVAARGARTGLVLMADLPQIRPADVREVVALAARHPVVLVRAGDGLHTNLLALSPPNCLPTSLGHPESFAAHLDSARAAGLDVRVLENARLAFDVDGPEDHARLTGATGALPSSGNGSADRG